MNQRFDFDALFSVAYQGVVDTAEVIPRPIHVTPETASLFDTAFVTSINQATALEVLCMTVRHDQEFDHTVKQVLPEMMSLKRANGWHLATLAELTEAVTRLPYEVVDRLGLVFALDEEVLPVEEALAMMLDTTPRGALTYSQARDSLVLVIAQQGSITLRAANNDGFLLVRPAR